MTESSATQALAQTLGSPDAIEAAACEVSLRQFIKSAWKVVEPGTDLIWNWHLDAIADHLAAVTRGDIKRLIVTVPPRHGKSLTVSVFWFCWTWVVNPSAQFLYASYAHDLSIRDSVRCRRLIQSNWFQKHWPDRFTLASDQNVKEKFDNDHGGTRIAASVGGQLTGHGGDFLVIDDAHNAVEGESDLVREGTIAWWEGAMSTRLNNPRTGAYVIIMQRLHERDLVGHILSKETGWDHLNLPARYEPDHPYPNQSSIGWTDPRTTESELLWPDRIGEDELSELEQRLGPFGTSGQLQQRPTPSGGGMFNRGWFGSWRDGEGHYELRNPDGEVIKRVFKSECWRIATADTAQTIKNTSDWSVRQVWDVTPAGDMIALDQWRERAQAPDVDAEMRRTLNQWRPSVLGIEEKQAGQGTVQRLQREGLPVQGIKANTDKMSRATNASVYAQNGRIFLPESAPWLPHFLDEVTLFPRAAYDDVTDCLSHAANLVANRDQWRPVLAEFNPALADEGGCVESVDEKPDKTWQWWVYLRYDAIGGAALLMAVTPEDKLVVFDERLASTGSAKLMRDEIEDMLADHGLSWNKLNEVCTAPEDDRMSKANIEDTPAMELREAGVESVTTWLPADVHGWQARIDKARQAFSDRRLVITERCERLMGEIRLWRHKQQPGSGVALSDRFEGRDYGIRCLLAWVASDPELMDHRREPMENPGLEELFGGVENETFV